MVILSCGLAPKGSIAVEKRSVEERFGSGGEGKLVVEVVLLLCGWSLGSAGWVHLVEDRGGLRWYPRIAVGVVLLLWRRACCASFFYDLQDTPTAWLRRLFSLLTLCLDFVTVV